MEQICSTNKVVSLHLERCSGYCPNSSQCYLMQRLHSVIPNSIPYRLELKEDLLQNFKVHEAICNEELNNWDVTQALLKGYPNYNITISSILAQYLYWVTNYPNQIQITIYNLNMPWPTMQKLYLIKDRNTWNYAYNLMCRNTGRLHFIIDRDFLRNTMGKTGLLEFIKKFQERVDKWQTADNCLTSWLVNGTCPYNYNNYIDINYDGTIRKCPYDQNKIGDITSIDSIRELFDLEFKPKCIYGEIFKGEANEQFNNSANLQDSNGDNGDGSSSQRVRRLSLRDRTCD